ncbi:MULTISPECIES: MarR family transcriptional regulator [Actinoplanes]|uniref:MarR family winged helix-turn-helix transcriptional regulator n=1 Tax=Actinoplanes TaxID=1865 RepID=UPI0005F2FE11|nr:MULTISPECIES: MarR family transcriptional regulator [Actinoplanes]GLY07127.1 DNA-binding protein [Actinoplanes sp. NBRC 101535]
MSTTDLMATVVAAQTLSMITADRLDEVFTRLHLTAATAQALWAVDPDGPPPSMKQMAERLYCNAPNLTFVTNQLIDRGLAEKTVDPSDRRSRVLLLTERGRQVRAEIIREALARTPFADLDPSEITQLRALLDKASGVDSAQ